MAALHIVWATANPILHLFAQQKLQLLKYFDPQKKKKKKKKNSIILDINYSKFLVSFLSA